MSYDQKCFALAEDWLAGEPDAINTPANRNELAQAIQDAIEDFLSDERFQQFMK